MEDTQRSQTISTESQGIAKQVTLSAGQQSYAPYGVSACMVSHWRTASGYRGTV